MAKQSGSPQEVPNDPRHWTQLHFWQIQAVRDIMFIAAVFGLVWAGYAMRSVTVPLLVALTLAYLFEPLIAWLTRNPKTSRPVVVGGLLLTGGLLVILILSIVIPLVINQSVRLVNDIREGRLQVMAMRVKDNLPEKYRDEFTAAPGWLMPEQANPPATAASRPDDAVTTRSDEDRIREIVRQELASHTPATPAGTTPQAPSSLIQFAKGGMNAVFGLLGAVVEIGLLAFLIPFYFFFFSVSYPAVVRFGRTLLPVANREHTLKLIRKMDHAVAGFVRGRIVISAITGVMLAIAWTPCRVPYSLVLGLVTGVFFAVPYLSVVGLPLAVGLLTLDQLAQPEGQRMTWFAILFWPSIVFIAVQVVESYILTPIIAGKATNLDPVTILVAVLAGGSVGGVYGMILAIPLAACAKILLTDVVMPRIKDWTHGRAQDPLPM